MLRQALFGTSGRKFRASSHRQSRPGVESLESRVVLYTATGNAWPAPQLITISFMPDGTNINGYSSNLFSTFNAKFGSASAWENLILKAAQLWAQQTNINFSVVTDNGGAQGSGSNQQGDPNFGDIRIGGYNQNSTALAMAYAPPPVNNYSVAGDVIFNTGQSFNNGSAYDLLTVAAHEIGHALGLGHSTTTAAEMYSAYNGVKSALNTDDIAGIRSIYSAGAARTPDANDSAGNGNTINTAVDVTSSLNGSTNAGYVTGLDITTTSDVDYYQVTAPTGSSSTATIVVQSQGLSLLSPKLIVYASDQKTVLATVSGLNQYGTTLTATLTGVTPGTTYYIKVSGADTTAFSTGTYALDLNFGTGATPTAPSPVTTLANGTPMSSGGGIATRVNGEVLVDSITTHTTQTSTQSPRAVGIDASGNSVVVWQNSGDDGSGSGIFAERFDAKGTKLGSVFQVNTTTAGDQTNATVAVAPDGHFLVTWQSAGQDGSGWGVFAQLFNASGTKVGGEFQVNTTTAGDQTAPMPAMDSSGNFTIVWTSAGQDGSGLGVYAQRFNASANKLGGEFQVNTTTAGDQTSAAIAVNASGNTIITWASNGQDGNGWGVYSQRYDASGRPVGGEFRVNTTTMYDQNYPNVAINASGNFIITWSSFGQDMPTTPSYGVYAQRYDASGNKVGTEFRANTYTVKNQMNSSVTMDSTGNFVIGWQSYGQDGSGWGIFARQFYANGTAVDAEVQISGSTAGDQLAASFAQDNLGHLVAVWTNTNNTAGGAVYLQAFNVALLADQSDGFSPAHHATPRVRTTHFAPHHKPAAHAHASHSGATVQITPRAASPTTSAVPTHSALFHWSRPRSRLHGH